jgi:hypothetical protein
MVYGTGLVDFCLVKVIMVYEVRTVWHTTHLPRLLRVLIGFEEWYGLYY